MLAGLTSRGLLAVNDSSKPNSDKQTAFASIWNLPQKVAGQMDISGTAVCMPRDASRDDVLAHLNKLHAYVNFRFDFPHSSRTISHCTSPFNLRLQFFKRVECNGTDSNVVKDPVEPKDEIRFFKVRI